jgi:hypothetical protein
MRQRIQEATPERGRHYRGADKMLRPNQLCGLMDWAQIFSQMALGAAAFLVH